MRIKLKEGKQKELILLAKKDLTWGNLSKKINVKKVYLKWDLKNEKVSIKEETYHELCRIANKNFDKFIIEKLNDNWGRSKGGLNSTGSTIKIKIPKRNKKLAELIGAILGDGSVYSYKKGKKIGVYQVNITGHKDLDKDYHINYLFKLFKELFNVNPIEVLEKKGKTRHLIVSSKQLVNFFIENELKIGDKIRNQVTIPNWIKENDYYLKSCLRGLIDTDGSIFRMSNESPHLLRICLTNYNITLLKDSRDSFIKLGFHPSKIIRNKQFFISRQEEINKYLKEINFSNKKHLDRLEIMRKPYLLAVKEPAL